MSNYNVLDSLWFGKVGIVAVKTEYDGIKFYIGTGYGISQEEDEQHIAAWGTGVDPSAITHFYEQNLTR